MVSYVSPIKRKKTNPQGEGCLSVADWGFEMGIFILNPDIEAHNAEYMVID